MCMTPDEVQAAFQVFKDLDGQLQAELWENNLRWRAEKARARYSKVRRTTK